MANMKSLLKDTAIYGLSSIIGRFLNYLLVPLYAYTLTTTGQYGVITNLYAWTGLLLVILTYGMETTFFRYANKQGEDVHMVYSTILRTVAFTSTLFVALVIIFLKPISQSLEYADHPSYIWVMSMTVALDAFQAIPFVYLRHEKRPLKFACLKLLFIGLSIALNLCFYLLFPYLYSRNPELVGKFYDPNVGPGYVFYINLFCTATVTFFFGKELEDFKFGFDWKLLRSMLQYTWPMLLLGIAGILNQTADKILFTKIYPGDNAQDLLGIYGGAAKIAAIMVMITQAFRYAYEPFVFGSSKEKDSRQTYAKGMKYFVIFTLLAFLGVMAYLDVLKFLVKDTYWEGLEVVPILMIAQILMGIYFNLSFWYKLTDKTIWGAVFSGTGCVVLLAINFLFVPKFSYMACAWAGVAGYGIAMLMSYFVGQKYYPISYPIGDMFRYVVLTVVLYVAIRCSSHYLTIVPELVVNTLLVGLFVIYVLKKDLPLAEIPVLGKLVRIPIVGKIFSTGKQINK